VKAALRVVEVAEIPVVEAVGVEVVEVLRSRLP
jgi:hypothetical protein